VLQDDRWEPSPPPGTDLEKVRDHQAELMIAHSARALDDE
jgi:polyphosphate kinase